MWTQVNPVSNSFPFSVFNFVNKGAKYNLLILAIVLLFYTSHYSNDNRRTNYNWRSQGFHFHSNHNPRLNSPAVQIYLFVFSDIENSDKKVKQSKRNKLAHAINGNRINVKKCIKVMELNKGSSHFLTNIEALKNHIYTHSPAICTLCESNSKLEDHLENEFPDYDIIKKSESNHQLDRIVILVKKDTISYERLKHI